MPNNHLDISIEESKIAVGVYSHEADGEYHEDFLKDVRELLEKQIKDPQVFIEEHHEDEFGHVYITHYGKRPRHFLKEKWNKIEYLIMCVYYGRTMPCADGFELYKIKKENNQVVDLIKMGESIDLEQFFIEKSFDNDFENAMTDNEISFFLLEELFPQN